MTETFTLKKDIDDIPVCAFQPGANALNNILWGAFECIDEVISSDSNGYVYLPNKPILDIDGDGEITEADLKPRNNTTGTPLYVGTTASDIDSNQGKFKIFVDSGLTSPAPNTEIKLTYWTVKPVKITNQGQLVVDRLVSGTQIDTDHNLTFANSELVNTQKETTITKPYRAANEYVLVIHNPSLVTDLTVKVMSVETNLGGELRDALIETITIPKAQTVSGTTINTHTRLITGIFTGSDLKLILSNDIELGAADGFTAVVRLKER